MALYREVLFPAAYDFLMGLGSLDERREAHLKGAAGEILEIGIGTGLNLPHYPGAVERITGLDANPGMLRKLEARRDARVRPVLANASEMPFGDDRFDTVVSTHTLCSLPDRAAALAEVRRVLKPGGRFLLLEHGRSPDPKVARWQKRLNGIQKRFAVGCLLDVPVEEEVVAAGFRFETLDTGYHARESKTHGYLYEGIAVEG